LPVTRDQKLTDLCIAVAGLQALADEESQVTRQRRVRIVDRLVLADHATEFERKRAGARLKRGIAQHLVGQYCRGRRGK
jgi:hypothetical protein